jgi:hypothetical protein
MPITVEGALNHTLCFPDEAPTPAGCAKLGRVLDSACVNSRVNIGADVRD